MCLMQHYNVIVHQQSMQNLKVILIMSLTGTVFEVSFFNMKMVFSRQQKKTVYWHSYAICALKMFL